VGRRPRSRPRSAWTRPSGGCRGAQRPAARPHLRRLRAAGGLPVVSGRGRFHLAIPRHPRRNADSAPRWSSVYQPARFRRHAAPV